MTYAIIGSGNVGSALARRFARSGIAVGIANTRGPHTMEALERELEGYVTPLTLEDALDSDVIILAIPFRAHLDVARALEQRHGKVIVDAMNTYGVPIEELGGRPSTVVVASAFSGASVVKAFNQLPAKLLASEPVEHGGRRVMFVAGDEASATAAVSKLISDLGFAPIELGSLNNAGTLIDRGGALVLQNLVKLG